MDSRYILPRRAQEETIREAEQELYETLQQHLGLCGFQMARIREAFGAFKEAPWGP